MEIDTAMAKGIEKGMSAALSKDIVAGFITQIKNLVSQREEKTYTLPCKDAAQYSVRVKSKQTLYNWIRWLGTHHPATILTRAGVTGSGYLQEDEGFEKETNLRTYAVVMVDPQNLLVWHADYVDNVDEKTLSGSFEKFLERACFSILGVTKDKWKPSTEALKKVFPKIWIGYCHRHCLKRFREAVEEYRKKKPLQPGEGLGTVQKVQAGAEKLNLQNQSRDEGQGDG